MNRLVLLGELDSLSMVVGDREAMVGIIEQVSDFEGDSDHDSGIENEKVKKKIRELPIAGTTQVNGDPSGASGSKGKAEEELDDDGERKKRKKAEKKARKEKERLERENQTLEASNNVDSSDEFQTDSKLKKKKVIISEDSKSSSVLESDLQPPKTPKDKSHVSLKTPTTPKTPKDTFELPSNFEVIEHKTEKKSWKSYQGPDGKKFRSMAEVKKYLESTSNLLDTIEFVATEWNFNEHEDLATNVKSFDLKDVKDLPKTDLYYVDLKPKPYAVKMASSDLPKQASAMESTNTSFSQDEELAKSSKHESDIDSSIRKKKKKKKNKSKDISLE